MANVFQLLPELEGDEMIFVQGLIKDLNENQTQMFATLYRAKRKDPQIILFTALIGFIGIAGIHRFILGHMGMGILYLFTGGLCLIGTIVDLVNYKNLAFNFNQREAQQCAIMVKSAS